MKFKKMTVAAVVSTIVLFVASLAMAHGPGRGGWRGGGMGMGFGQQYLSALDLTQEQRSEMNRLRSQFLNETAELRGKLMVKKIELRALISNPEAKSEEIIAKKREILKIRTEFAEKRIAHQARMRTVLTKEQLGQIGDWGFGRGYGRGWKHGRGWGQGHGMGQDWGYGHNCPKW